jgi:hypothetical protein
MFNSMYDTRCLTQTIDQLYDQRHSYCTAASHTFRVATSFCTLLLLSISFQLLLVSNSLARSQSLLPFPPRDSPMSFTKFHLRPQRLLHSHGTHLEKRLRISRRIRSMVAILGISRHDSMCSMYSVAMTNGFLWMDSRYLEGSWSKRIHVSTTFFGVDVLEGPNCLKNELTLETG